MNVQGSHISPSTAPLDASESLKLLDRQSLEQKPRDSDTGSMGEVYKANADLGEVLLRKTDQRSLFFLRIETLLLKHI